MGVYLANEGSSSSYNPNGINMEQTTWIWWLNV